MTTAEAHPAATTDLLDRFLTGLREALPAPFSLWAHGSLAGGDYQEGRSDLDLIAVVPHPLKPDEETRLATLHEGIDAELPLAAHLHCSYMPHGDLDDPDRTHFTWAHREAYARTVTPITRRELHTYGLVLHGDPIAGTLPTVDDRTLREYILTDLDGYWRPRTGRPELWLENVWVDLGLMVLARATVTLRDGTLVSKAEALAVLTELGAPAEVVADIERRRYEGGPADTAPDPGWLARRAELTLDWLVPALDRTVAEHTADS
ncbi:nucleotidyltransferase domain-containing protein [Streptomyces sp. NBC_01361]|uniref:nucleotidyltransferase domain-containing protein n=1 Tax=Streptomyces sp. NBC_01361 TaxID=2903838 RepID=UPI002E2F8354|nr:nucleotidyltransferase domain-containing protein [Streptomyces sp. NBC_01361]